MFLGVSATLLPMKDEQRLRIGQQVAAERRRRGWSKEKLAEAATISTTTLRRVEDGLNVQDHKLHLVLATLGMHADEAGDLEPDLDASQSSAFFVLPEELEYGYNETVKFARAISRNAPFLGPRAARLMIDAAGLFADAGDEILRNGGDGPPDETHTTVEDRADRALERAAAAEQDRQRRESGEPPAGLEGSTA